VVGTVIFVVIFLVALGSMAYVSGLQEQAAAAQQQAELADWRRSTEVLTFATVGSKLMATNEGPASVFVNHLVLKYPNGTVYPLSSSGSISSGGSAPVRSMVPDGLCSPGTATCLSKYEQIVAGNPPGSSVGLVTSNGNSFWYADTAGQVDWSSLTKFPAGCPAGEAVVALNTTLTCAPTGASSSWLRSSVSAEGFRGFVPTGLTAKLSPNASYAFYVFTAVEPEVGIESYNFEVHPLPSGATLVIACSPLSYPRGGGNQPTNCVSTTGTPIAAPRVLDFGAPPPIFATPGIFGVVTTGSAAGLLEIDFGCTDNCGGVVLEAGSFMLVQPLG
jgi:hypothetical protein